MTFFSSISNTAESPNNSSVTVSAELAAASGTAVSPDASASAIAVSAEASEASVEYFIFSLAAKYYKASFDSEAANDSENMLNF